MVGRNCWGSRRIPRLTCCASQMRTRSSNSKRNVCQLSTYISICAPMVRRAIIHHRTSSTWLEGNPCILRQFLLVFRVIFSWLLCWLIWSLNFQVLVLCCRSVPPRLPALGGHVSLARLRQAQPPLALMECLCILRGFRLIVYSWSFSVVVYSELITETGSLPLRQVRMIPAACQRSTSLEPPMPFWYLMPLS